MRLLIIIAMCSVPANAWADRSASFKEAPLTIRVPDDWTFEQLASEDGLVFYRPGEVHVGRVELNENTTCDELVAYWRDSIQFPITAFDHEGTSWRGPSYTKGGANYAVRCLDATLGGRAYVIKLDAPDAEVETMIRLVDTALAQPAAAEPTPTGTGVLALAATKLTVTIGPGWTTKVSERWDEIYDDEGTLAASVAYSSDPCDVALAKAAAGDVTSAYDPGVAGWAGFQVQLEDGTTQLIFCRGLTTPSGVRGGLIVITEGPMYTTLVVQAIEDVLVKSDATLGATTKPGEPGPSPRRPGSASPSWYTFLPDRYELGLARLTDGDTGSLFDDEGWGGTLNVERTLYGRGVPAWGYRVRATPTGAGFAGHAEGTIGASSKGFSIGGVAGVGVAGDASPSSVHGGFHVGVLLPFFEIEGGYAWTQNGTVFRFEGGFLIPVGGWGAGIRIGYERREDSTMITIDWGAVRYPTGLVN